ncbi:MAG: hypothetical protein HZB16_20425 [Armatimonadetes bacterium]|nr:hypothetical protein [Armatimonadota bacterium]
MRKSALGVGIIVAFVALVAARQLMSTGGSSSAASAGTPAERAIVAAKAAQQPVVLAFRSNSCRPCVAMGQVLAELRPRYGDRVAIIDVSLDEGTPDVKLIEAHQIRTKPTTVLLTKNGDLAETKIGLWPAAELAKRLDDLVSR